MSQSGTAGTEFARTYHRKNVRAGFRSALFGTSCRLIKESAAMADNNGLTSFGAIMPTFEIYDHSFERDNDGALIRGDAPASHPVSLCSATG